MSNVSHRQLKRELGVGGAVMMGLGAMVGTGVFVSIGIAAGITGPSVIVAVAIAACVAVCNALSSAQLAASHPVSGGTYEYGYEYINSWLGFSAGWMFLIAKSASAATAALGFAGYLMHALGHGGTHIVPIALAAVVALTASVLAGIRRANATNIIIVSATLIALLLFVLSGFPRVSSSNLLPLFDGGSPATALRNVLYASALMFVAYTGYGRIATLGEEVHDPKRTIPRAIIITMIVSMALYISVAYVGTGILGAEGLKNAVDAEAAPLVVAAEETGLSWLPLVLAVGAITAMLGVLLNLIVGLSRVLLAMGRRRDMPPVFARLNASRTTPYPATIAVAALVAGLTVIGDVKTTWTFSAFTVLIYYAITNLASLRLPAKDRLYPRWISATGLASCVLLAFCVDVRTWAAGLGILALGLLWHAAARRARS
ncbi:MAG: APC family permease [Verrucomicrobia bacterium]|nr:APC family permease [Verrucomicrobiota bacterium]